MVCAQSDSHHALDEIFEDWSGKVCSIIHSLPSERIDVLGEDYDQKHSTKSSTRKARAASKTAKKSSKKKINRVAVEKLITHETELPSDMKLSLTVAANKRRLQLLVGNDLIRNVPENKAITVSGMFEDPTEIRSNKLTIPQLEELQCDHEEADTRIILHAIKCDKPRTVIYGNDTDIIVGVLCKTDQFGNKEVFMRRSRNDFIPIIRVGQGLINRCNLQLASLSIFHPITGMDQTSFLYDKGKVKCWDAYLKYHVSINSTVIIL